VVQTAMQLGIEPVFAADLHDCSYGYRPKRDAQQAALAMREDLYHRAWGVVEIDCKSYCTSIPHGKLLKLIAKRLADGSRLQLSKQTLTVGVKDTGQGVPTTVGVPQGAPISPLYRHSYLNRLDHLWHRRGYPQKLGATLHRYAEDGAPRTHERRLNHVRMR
jgi:RNA-directed DNA polymerase